MFLLVPAVRLQKFYLKRDPSVLDSVADDLQQFVAGLETKPDERRHLRGQVLETWLELLTVIDANLDPTFDEDDVPTDKAMPPRVGNTQFPPGVDPSLISDVDARREYERDIAANEQKAVRYRLQYKLRRLDERVPQALESFVLDAYTTSTADKLELEEAIRDTIPNQRRAERLHRRLVLREDV